ncbi:cecropin family domain-containing protein [Phthorimaea operculella]|nr:cecropin family domain-containing protein [Phthorimaea operculella]
MVYRMVAVITPTIAFPKRVDYAYSRLSSLFRVDRVVGRLGVPHEGRVAFVAALKSRSEFTKDNAIAFQFIVLSFVVALIDYTERVGQNIRDGLIKAGPAVAVVGQASSIYKQG